MMLDTTTQKSVNKLPASRTTEFNGYEIEVHPLRPKNLKFPLNILPRAFFFENINYAFRMSMKRTGDVKPDLFQKGKVPVKIEYSNGVKRNIDVDAPPSNMSINEVFTFDTDEQYVPFPGQTHVILDWGIPLRICVYSHTILDQRNTYG